MATTIAASNATVAGCQCNGTQRLASHQRSTVAAEAQLPGPGRNLPIPKNVAMSVMRWPRRPRPLPVPNGVEGSKERLVRSSNPCPVCFSLLELLWSLSWRALFHRFADVLHRRRDHIRSTGPLAQINQPAACAAEGKILRFRRHRLFANGTTQLAGAFARHRLLDDAGNQVVVVGFRDFTAIELAGLRLAIFGEIVDENFAINLRRVHWSTSFIEKIGFRGGPLQ